MITQSDPYIDINELKNIKKILNSKSLMNNDCIEVFEKSISEYTGANYCVAVNNATSGIFCCLRSLGVGCGDEVIIPNMTFIATSNAVILANATPVFCDVSLDNCCIDPNKIEEKITSKTKAIIIVHLLGMTCDVDAILKIAKKYNLKIIEDIAQSFGVFINGTHTGLFGDAGVTSFNTNKIITCDKGGAIITNDKQIQVSCRRLRNHGRDTRGGFVHEHVGFNFMMTGLQAAIGISQMAKLKKIIDKKKKIYERYCKSFSKIKNIEFFNIGTEETSNYWFSSFIFERKNELCEFLNKNGVQTRDFFYPLNMQPCYKSFSEDGSIYENSLFLYNNSLSLPSSFSLTYAQQKYIIDKILLFYSE